MRGLVLRLVIMVGGIACSAASPAAADHASDEETGTFVLVVENDLFRNTDRGYTSGIRVGWITPPDHAPDWIEHLARQLPWFKGWKRVRAEYTINQAIFTPANIRLREPDPRDRPYAGWLETSFALIGETKSTLDQLSVSVGMVGPASLGEHAQNICSRSTTNTCCTRLGISTARRAHVATAISAKLAARLRALLRQVSFGSGLDSACRICTG